MVFLEGIAQLFEILHHMYSGKQFFPYVHMEDEIGIILHAMEVDFLSIYVLKVISTKRFRVL